MATVQIAIATVITASTLLVVKQAYGTFVSCMDSDATWKVRSPCGSGCLCGCDLSTEGSTITAANFTIDIPCCCSITREEHVHEDSTEHFPKPLHNLNSSMNIGDI